MNIEFLVGPLIGGFIGAFTNWVSMQMIFLPLYEKRIFGIRVPFTPGLLPKERKKIAKTIASTVSNYFLSEEIIINTVISKDTEKHFREYIRQLIDNQKKNEQTISEFINNITGLNFEEITNAYESQIAGYIFNQFKQNNKFLEDIVINLVNENIDKSINDILSKTQITNKVIDFLNSEHTKEIISQVISQNIYKFKSTEKSINDILPNEFLEYIKKQAILNSDIITSVLIDYISNSNVQYKIRKILNNRLDESLKLRVISKLINVDRMFENILNEIVKYLQSSSSRIEISNYIVKLIDSVSYKSPKEIIENLEIELDEKSLNEKISMLISNIKLDNFFALENIINTKITVREVLSIINEQIILEKEQFAKTIINWILDNVSVEDILRDYINSVCKDISNIKINKVTSVISNSNSILIEDTIIKYYRELVKSQSEKMLEIINVSKIIEERINEFDIAQMEELMIGSIKKDIMVMRLFQAGIGAIIGFMIPLYPYMISFINNLIK